MPEPRIVFMGTSDLARTSLAALVQSGLGTIPAIVTQPDRPSGRALKPAPSPVKQFATERHLPVLQPERLRHPDAVAQIAALEPDLVIVAAYGQILPQTVLDLPRHGCLNVHASLLPKYRGAAPIQYAILNDDGQTGITIMQMEAGMDTGPILTQRETEILPDDDAMTLHDRLARIGGQLLVETIPGYLSGDIQPRTQPMEGVSHAPKIRKEDGQIDWRKTARSIWNQVRAFIPWPGAFTTQSTPDGPRLLKLWKVAVEQGRGGDPGVVLEAGPAGLVIACGTDSLRVLELQREGGRRLEAAAFLAGHPLRAGEQLTIS
jgi:methionyl-tRNA formyltransferase